MSMQTATYNLVAGDALHHVALGPMTITISAEEMPTPLPHLVSALRFKDGQIEELQARVKELESDEYAFQTYVRQAEKLSADIAHLKAIQSGRLHFTAGEPVTLDDGTPVTPEMLRALGWELGS